MSNDKREYKSPFDDKRIILIYIIVIIAILAGVTYALQSTSIAFNIGTAIVKIDEDAYGSNVFDSSNLDMVPILDSEVETRTNNVIKIDFTVGGAQANNADKPIIYDIALVDLMLDCELVSTPYLKWKLVKNGTELSSGSFHYGFDTINNGRLVLTNIQEDLPNYSSTGNGYHNYSFYIWLSDSCQSENLLSCVNDTEAMNGVNGLLNGYFSGKIEVELYTGSKKELFRTPTDSLDESTCKTKEVNPPNLDSNNLIPVYYDETAEVWKKADSTNSNNSWYDYDNKKWANAVMVKDNTKRSTYQSADVNTTITESDISGFLVWIPRFKYRVWNITRQGGAEDTYAYPAYTNGIDIEWESGTASTGNVSCSYKVDNSSPATTLSDQCTVDGTTITPESGNTNFTDAWYTHPAFKFNNSNKTGFWIGKFETTGTASSPTVLPDTAALVNQNVSTQFTTSKVFQTYGLSNSVDAHMLTNLEWGAMAYLTHSVYGLCDGTTCRDAYINNSENKITGRSAGLLAPNSTSSTYGTYNYKGYPIDSSTGSSTGTKDATLVASSTGNITGVYDISGGAYEYVMGNIVDENNAFNPISAGDSWNGSTTPSTFYYNPYSYGETYADQIAFNRAYLGDATAEVTGNVGNYMDAWQPGTGIIGSGSGFGPNGPWFIRGGFYYTESGSFFFFAYDGNEDGSVSFRLSLS